MTGAALIRLLMASSKPPGARVTFFVNPLSYCRLARQALVLPPEVRVVPDGILMVLLLRWVGGVRVHRQSFDYSSLASVVFEGARREELRVAVIGSTPEANKRFVQHLRENFPGIQVVYSRDGFFHTDEERRAAVQCLLDSRTDLLIVGMGAPLQERLVADAVACGYGGTAYTCGAFISQAARHGCAFYPAWADRLHLRWLVRSLREKGLIWRYLLDYPPALVSVAIGILKERYFGAVQRRQGY